MHTASLIRYLSPTTHEQRHNHTTPISHLRHGQHFWPLDDHNVRRPDTGRRSLRDGQRRGQRAHRVGAGAQRAAAAAAAATYAAAVLQASLVPMSAAAATHAVAAGAVCPAVCTADAAAVVAAQVTSAAATVVRIVTRPTAAQNVSDPPVERLFSATTRAIHLQCINTNTYALSRNSPQDAAQLRRKQTVDERIGGRIERRQTLDERGNGDVRLGSWDAAKHLQQIEDDVGRPAQNEHCNQNGVRALVRVSLPNMCTCAVIRDS